mgnify:CR=1 FL=1
MKQIFYLFLFLILIISVFTVVSCDPADAFDGVNGRRGISFKNDSKSNLTILHISAYLYVKKGDSTIYKINSGEEKIDLEQTDTDVYSLLNLKMKSDFDTIKVFCEDKQIATYSGPLTEKVSGKHTPYETNCWEKVEKQDTIYLKFTFTDEDFE